MEYLVESHMGSYYYISDDNPSEICRSDPETGDSDTILLSWHKGKKIETLKGYFSGIRKDSKTIKKYIKDNYDSETIKTILSFSYKYDERMINMLTNDNILSLEERNYLLDINKQAEERQIELYEKVINKKVKKLTK